MLVQGLLLDGCLLLMADLGLVAVADYCFQLQVETNGFVGVMRTGWIGVLVEILLMVALGLGYSRYEPLLQR